MQRTSSLSRGLPLLIICSTRMYRQRIKDWGLDKNHKDKEMKAIVQKYEARVAEGKDSVICIRGREIDYQDVVRYWKRKNMSIDAVIALRSMSRTPEAIEFHTPVPSPIRTPELLALPECIFRTLRDYHQGYLEDGTWRSDGESRYCQTTKLSSDETNWTIMLHDQCMLSITLIHEDAFEEARCEYDQVCALIEKAILAERPDTFFMLLRIVLYAYHCPWPEVGLDILGKISSMGGRLLGDRHPFKLVCGWLASLDLFDQSYNDNILLRSSEAIYETFKRSLGPLHYTTIASLLEQFHMVRVSNQNTERQESALHNLSDECETALSQDDDRVLEVRLYLAFHYLDRCDYSAARRQAQALLVQNASNHGQIQGLKMLACSLYELGEIHKAFDTRLQAIDLAIHKWGADDPEAQRMMLLLEGWMLEQGMPESAAQVHKERLRLADYGTDSSADDTKISYDLDAE